MVPVLARGSALSPWFRCRICKMHRRLQNVLLRCHISHSGHTIRCILLIRTTAKGTELPSELALLQRTQDGAEYLGPLVNHERIVKAERVITRLCRARVPEKVLVP